MALLPPPDITAAYVSQDGKPTKEFFNWIKSLGVGASFGGGGGSLDWINVKDAPYNAAGDGVTDDTAAIQSAIDAAFGTAGSPHANTNPELNRQLYFPRGKYRVTDELVFTKIFGGKIFGAGRFATQLIADMPDGSFTFRTNGCSYTTFSDMNLQGPFLGGCIDLDYDGGANANCQSNTFFNMYFDEASHGAKYGVRIAHSGGSAMGSENLFANCFWVGSYDPSNPDQAGIVTQGQNALQNTVVGGNFQNLAYGIWVQGGSVTGVFSAGFQQSRTVDIRINDDTANNCCVSGCRTESVNFIDSGLQSLSILGCLQVDAGAGNGTFLALHSGGATISGCYSAIGNIFIEHWCKLTIYSSIFDRTDWLDADPGNTWSMSSGFGLELYGHITASNLGNTNLRSMELVKSNDGVNIYQRQVASCEALTNANIAGLTFGVGDIIWQNRPVAGASPGWICTTAGVAGSTAVFKAMANLAP